MTDVLIGLYELTQAMIYPDGTDPGEPDVPYTRGARLIWLNHRGNRYGDAAESTGTTLYHVTALRNAAGLPIGTPSFCQGMRVYAWYNRQSARWEMLASALSLLVSELTATFMPGDAEVGAILLDSVGEPAITAHRAAGPNNQGVGRVGTTGHAGTLGWVLWNPLRAQWEILGGQFKLLCEAKADAAIDTGNSGTVSLWWKDYATGTLIDSGQDVTALNWLHPQIQGGDKLIVSYDRQEDRWTVVAAE